MNSLDLGRIVQYLWDPEPRNDEEPDAPVWCLGAEYRPDDRNAHSGDSSKFKVNTKKIDEDPHVSTVSPTSTSRTDREGPDQLAPEGTVLRNPAANSWPESFLLDFESKIWMTYRSNFPPIPRSDSREATSMTLSVRLRSQLIDPQGFTSDTGWGCMIRSGQSLLANAMSTLLLGRDWRRGNKIQEEMQLLSLFADFPEAPFSIHRFVKHGAESCNKYPGEWFGPSATARCIQALSTQYGSSMLRVYITDDTSDVYEDKFLRVARDDSGFIHPTLILVGTRLGIDHITPVYWDGLRTTLQLPQSVGIAGGRPSASHYFIGVQGSYLFYLDPHHTRPALPLHKADEPYSEAEVDTYHTRRLRRIHIKDMDPSMLIGFLIKDEKDWNDWKKRVASAKGKPIVHISNEMKPAYCQGRKEALDEVEALDDAWDSD